MQDPKLFPLFEVPILCAVRQQQVASPWRKAVP